MAQENGRKPAEDAIGLSVAQGGAQSTGQGTVSAAAASSQAGTFGAGAKETPSGEATVIKKYANRRLYNTATSCYVTLDHLSQMVKEGIDFVVYDAKTAEDITRSVLTQIIVEEESKGQNLLPISFLRQLISLYGDSMQWMVPRYLEHSMRSFAHNHDQMRKVMQETLGGMFPFGNLEEMSKQNMAMFERAMKMFTPFQQDPSKPGAEGGGPAPDPRAFDELKGQLDALRAQLELFSKMSKSRTS
ncbi:MAG: polyhydroxyalkanoate synthesis repressor PhaR [Alphaproteobacteria bacterium]|nr:polyhydroxyalkanoate synthesis repressor PhaR [Alphaproteobacteria bacterium]